jgi:hypothetical protein
MGLIKKYIIYVKLLEKILFLNKNLRKFKDWWTVDSYKICVFLHTLIHLPNKFLVLKFDSYQCYPFLYVRFIKHRTIEFIFFKKVEHPIFSIFQNKFNE